MRFLYGFLQSLLFHIPQIDLLSWADKSDLHWFVCRFSFQKKVFVAFFSVLLFGYALQIGKSNFSTIAIWCLMIQVIWLLNYSLLLQVLFNPELYNFGLVVFKTFKSQVESPCSRFECSLTFMNFGQTIQFLTSAWFFPGD